MFRKLFGNASFRGNEDEKGLPWVPLTDEAQLAVIKTMSYNRPQCIYKHSSTCGISTMVFKSLENQPEMSEDLCDFYFLDIHRHRRLSDALAAEYEIRHESPQFLIVKQGKLLYAASHGAIAELDFQEFL